MVLDFEVADLSGLLANGLRNVIYRCLKLCFCGFSFVDDVTLHPCRGRVRTDPRNVTAP